MVLMMVVVGLLCALPAAVHTLTMVLLLRLLRGCNKSDSAQQASRPSVPPLLRLSS
jgi:hypothetical protein